MVGRAFSRFSSCRCALMWKDIAKAKAKDRGIPHLTNQTAIDMLQPGDVLVVDLFGKKVNGTIVGDNLLLLRHEGHAQRRTGGGRQHPRSGRNFRDRHARLFPCVDPTPIGDVMLTGINVPVRIGGVTVMPGDLVVGDREGVYFVPPQLVKEVLDHADETHIHDEWTKKKFDEGKYKSSEIYGIAQRPEVAAGIQGLFEKAVGRNSETTQPK